MKKAFTIIELLVAMALLAILIAISGMVFSAAVKAYRTAGAAAEISSKLQVITQQLDDDFRGLRKDGEFIMVWVPSPELTREGYILDENADSIPDRCLSFDRLLFFTSGNFQTYNSQPADTNGDGTVDGTKMVYSNLARICYSFGRDGQDVRAPSEAKPEKRLFCRTQHLISGDADLPTFPNLLVAWDAADFETKNFSYEYQTMTMEDWVAIPVGNPAPIKDDILSKILDLRVGDSTLPFPQGGPRVDLTDSSTLHQLFMQGIGQFHVQVWIFDPTLNRYRWYPEIDPDADGIYNEGVTVDDGHTDYTLNGNEIDYQNLSGLWVWDINNFDAWIGPALKFTFTLYDSNGVFKDGKTFTHIVYIK